MPARQPFGTEKFEQPTIRARPDAKEKWVVSSRYPQFTGVLAKVPFQDGRAIVYDEALARELVADFECTTEPALKVHEPAKKDRSRLINMAPDARLEPGADPELLKSGQAEL